MRTVTALFTSGLLTGLMAMACSSSPKIKSPGFGGGAAAEGGSAGGFSTTGGHTSGGTGGSSGRGSGGATNSNLHLIGEETPAGTVEIATERNDLLTSIPTDIVTSPNFIKYDGEGSYIVLSQTLVARTNPNMPELNLGDYKVPTIFKVGPDATVAWSSQIDIGANLSDGIAPYLVGIVSMILAPSGDTFFTGAALSPIVDPSDPQIYASSTNLLTNEQYHGGYLDAIVGKLDSMGHVSWIHYFGTPEDDEATHIVLAADGSPIIFGKTLSEVTASGLKIGNRFIASFSTDGALQWSSVQSQDILASVPGSWLLTSEVVADGVGNIYESASNNSPFVDSTSIDPYGGFRNVVQSFQQNDGTLRFTTDPQNAFMLAVTPDGSHIYTADNASLCTLTAYSPVDGSVQWQRTASSVATRVFTPDKTQYWLGGFSSCDTIVATDDTVFIAGQWFNSYSDRTAPPFGAPPGTFYVGAYDLDGNKKWLVQLTPVATDTGLNDTARLFLDNRGNPLLIFAPLWKKKGPIEVAHLNAVDGKLLP